MARRDHGGGCLGCLTVIVLAVALMCALVFNFGPPIAGNILEAFGRRATSSVSDLKDRITGDEGKPAEPKDTSGLGYAGSMLSETQQHAYLQLLEGLMAHEETFPVFEVTAEDIDPAYNALIRDHPEIFWIDGYLSYTYSKVGSVVSVTAGYTRTVEEAQALKAQIEATADAFLASLGEGATEYDVAQAAYAYIISTTDYDIAATDSQNIVSVLVNHSSVCAGYARTYQYLLQRAGVFCAYVEGTVGAGIEDHAWNLIRADGVYAYVDPTWGDPAYLGTASDIDTSSVIYDYLGLTTEEITRDGHAFSDPEGWPVCDSYDLDYYRRAGMFFESYDTAALEASFATQSATGQRMCAFKFARDEDLAQARSDIDAGTFLLSSLSSQTTTYSYTISDSLRIVKLYW